MRKHIRRADSSSNLWLPGFEPVPHEQPEEKPSFDNTVKISANEVTGLPKAQSNTPPSPPSLPESQPKQVESSTAPLSAKPVEVIVEKPAEVIRRIKRQFRNFSLPANFDYARTPPDRFDANIRAIETLAAVEAADRDATDDEKLVLARYSGWGGLSEAFGGTNPAWDKRRERLRALLGDSEYESARSSVLNAHYTDPEIIRQIYAALQRLGFNGGRILDPSTGIGHFIGAMPKDIERASALTAVELDSLSGRIAKVLYPDTSVLIGALEKTALPADHFDLVVSNVPFGDYAVFDPALKSKNVLVHDYFFLKAASLVRPGGLIAFITSTGTLDKDGKYIRTILSQSCDLVGAIRMPGMAFEKIASTEVPTDVIFLRRRLKLEASNNIAWRDLKAAPLKSGGIRNQMRMVNEYFDSHANMVIGAMGIGYRGNSQMLKVDFDGDLIGAIAERVSLLPEDVYADRVEELHTHTPSVVRLDTKLKQNSLCVVNGQVMRVGQDGQTAQPVSGLGKKAVGRVAGLADVRDALKEVLRTQVADESAADIAAAMKRLNQTYDRFVSEFGIIHDRMNRRVFRGDPDLPSLLALEDYDDESGSASKMPIFSRRTIQPAAEPSVASTPDEALVMSLNWKGGVDPAFMSRLYTQMTWDEVSTLLMEKGLIWLSPDSEKWEAREVYLAGNIRKKLKAAQLAAMKDPFFERHVSALKNILPTDLTPKEIDAGLGAAWIPDHIVKQFVCELLETPHIEVKHSLDAAVWKVSFTYHAGVMEKSSVANTHKWGTSRLSALDLVNDGLNQVTPTVYEKDVEGKQFVNTQESMLAREKLAAIRNHFREWVWQDESRAAFLCELYNEEYNSMVLPAYDGSHLTFPWMSDAIIPRQYQKDAVWRYLCGGNLLLAHCVGAGKTATAIMAHMEAKRLGIFKKTLFVVPNHMLEQYAAEFLRIYPAANLLCASKEDLAGDRRRELLGRIATGDWDGVIITHASYEKLALNEEFLENFIEDEMYRLDSAIDAAWGDGDRAMAKRLESLRNSVNAKLEKLYSGASKDNHIGFDELGVDSVVVDEAQAFKNLLYVTKISRVAGLPNSVSRRALDMYAKVQYIQAKHNGVRGVMFTTATPIANSMAEMFTVQRYLSRHLLREHAIESFDAWAATFGRIVSAMEIAPDGGGFRMNSRFAQFVNLPELMQLFGSIADVKTREEINLPVPALVGGKPEVIKTVPNDDVKQVVKALVARAERIRNGVVKPAEDNMLSVTGDGRRAALDIRLYNPIAEDDPNSKVNVAVRKVFEIWQQTATERKTQLVFCDLSTPKKVGFSVYNDMRDKWIAMGIPQEEIAFIHDYDTDERKASLFRAVRKGNVRILMGSTQKMGVGTNVQRKLVALHHLDAPWRPDEVEQRDGRALRPGNLNKEIMIFRYVTEATFDAYIWQNLEVKAKFIAQVMAPGCKVRTAEDVVVAALTYAEVKAISTGNPLFLKKAEVEASIAKLAIMHRDWEYKQWSIKRELESMPRRVERAHHTLEQSKRDAAAVKNVSGEAFEMVINKKVVRDSKSANQMLEGIWQNAARMKWEESELHLVGNYGGFDLKIQVHPMREPAYRLVGELQHEVNTATVWTAALANVLKRIVDRVREAEDDVDLWKKRMADLQVQVSAPFEMQAELDRLYGEQDEIYTALGLTEDQSYGAEDKPGEDPPEEETIEAV